MVQFLRFLGLIFELKTKSHAELVSASHQNRKIFDVTLNQVQGDEKLN